MLGPPNTDFAATPLESSCEIVKLDEDKYRKANVPESLKKGEKMKIAVWIDVMDIAEINEPEVG